MTASARPDWIAADWGTTSLRVWAMAGDRVLAARDSDEGMGKLAPGGFEPALLRLIGDWLPEASAALPVIACGMVGARQGWSEAAYRTVPCPPLGPPFHRITPDDRRIAVHILPGLAQPDPADVMRGEETQIAGFLATEPGFDGTLALPGTHNKWVAVEGGRIIRFQTCMTGELFALLTGQSVLRHGLGQGWDAAAFAQAVTEAAARPETVMTELFALRARGLLHGYSGDSARARLSGLLIGAELVATRPLWQGEDIALIGAGPLVQTYAVALAALGQPARVTEGATITLAGLIAAHRMLQENAA